MRSMRLRIGLGSFGAGTQIDAFCEDPDLDREVILAGQRYDGAETVTSYVYGDPAAYETLLEDAPGVIEYDLTPDGDGCVAFVRRELGEGGLSIAHAIERETVVLVPPVELRSDRTLTLTLVGHADDLSEAVAELPDDGEVSVLQVHDGPPTRDAGITERQREALEAARRVGYYEVPRRNGIEAVAAELDCAVSTASALLRRGEAAAVDGSLGPGR